MDVGPTVVILAAPSSFLINRYKSRPLSWTRASLFNCSPLLISSSGIIGLTLITFKEVRNYQCDTVHFIPKMKFRVEQCRISIDKATVNNLSKLTFQRPPNRIRNLDRTWHRIIENLLMATSCLSCRIRNYFLNQLTRAWEKTHRFN